MESKVYGWFGKDRNKLVETHLQVDLGFCSFEIVQHYEYQTQNERNDINISATGPISVEQLDFLRKNLDEYRWCINAEKKTLKQFIEKINAEYKAKKETEYKTLKETVEKGVSNAR